MVVNSVYVNDYNDYDCDCDDDDIADDGEYDSDDLSIYLFLYVKFITKSLVICACQ